MATSSIYRLILIFCGMSFCVLPAHASSTLMRGIEAYRKSDYVLAQSLLRQAIKAAPEDSVAHYYLGNTLLKLKNPAAAKAEFQSASDSSETDDVKNNSQFALQKLQTGFAKKIDFTPNQNKAKFDAGIDDLFKKNAGNSLRLDSMPLTADEKKAISPYVKHNGELDTSKSPSMFKDLLPADLRNKAQAMSSQDPALPGLLSDFLGQSQFGSSMNPVERKAFVEDQLHKRNMTMDSVLKMINGKSDANPVSKPNSVQDERAKRLKEVQENLDDQINSKVGDSGVHLQKEGTSIYIRNYEHY